MKKAFIILLLLLTSCAFKQDYYELTVDNYSITVGYDNSEYLKVLYDYDLIDELKPNEVIEDVNLYLLDSLFASAQFSNSKNKYISSDKARLTKIVVYINDLKGRTFKINGIQLDDSVKNNCETFNGNYINKNGRACVIENKVANELNVIELHGDYLNIDQDKLDHIIIYVK